MIDQSYRGVISRLRTAGEVVDVAGQVSLDYELAAIIGLWDDGPVVYVEETDRGQFPIYANILNTRQRIAGALGIRPEELLGRLEEASNSSTHPTLQESGPCQEVVVRAGDVDDLLAILPLPKFFERDSGPYLTAGVVCAHEASSGFRNASYARVKPIGKNRAIIGIAPNHHLMSLAKLSEAEGNPLPIAIALGCHPAIQLAACLYLNLGRDELGNAASLMHEAVRAVRGISVDVNVPADAEIVVEALLHPSRQVDEGWTSEYHGMYEDYGPAIELEITAVTHRVDATFQVVLPGLFSEHALLGALPIGAGLTAALRRARIDVSDLAVRKCGGGRVDVVAAVKGLKPGAARRAFFTCWSSVSMVKQVTLVDADVDVWDDEHVEWARVARMRWDEDVLIVPDVITDRNEPMQAGGVVGKVGMDATAKEGRRRTGWGRALPPRTVVQQAFKRLEPYTQMHALRPGIGLAPLMRSEVDDQ